MALELNFSRKQISSQHTTLEQQYVYYSSLDIYIAI